MDDSAFGWEGHIGYGFVRVLRHKKADDGTSGVVGGATFGADGVRNDLLRSLPVPIEADHVAEMFEEGNAVVGKAYDWGLVRIVGEYVDCCRRRSIVDAAAAQRWSLLLLPSAVLVCHSRGRSLDMISPALRICMETARARLALAVSPGKTSAE